MGEEVDWAVSFYDPTGYHSQIFHRRRRILDCLHHLSLPFPSSPARVFGSQFCLIWAKMLRLLFSVIFSQMFMILVLLFRTPLRKYVIMSLDKMKRGRGPVVVTTVAATVLVVFISTVNSIFDISRREIEPGAVNPTDLVLMARSLLDASLMGFILFLGLMTDRLHFYIRELRLLRKAVEASQKQNQRLEAEAKSKADEIAALKNRVETLKSECAAKADATRTAERNVEALKRQSEGLLGEYDRMFEDNQNLRRQLRYIDENLSRSVVKKNMLVTVPVCFSDPVIAVGS